MQPPVILAAPDRRRPGSVALRRTCLILAPCWALMGAVLCAATFGYSIQFPPPPALEGPLPSSGWYAAMLVAFFPSACLAASPLILLVTGLSYLRSAALTGWRWIAGWAAAAGTGIAVEALLVRAVAVSFAAAAKPPVPVPGPVPADWGPLGLSAGFVAAGAAMIWVMVSAARAGRRQPRRAA